MWSGWSHRCLTQRPGWTHSSFLNLSSQACGSSREQGSLGLLRSRTSGWSLVYSQAALHRSLHMPSALSHRFSCCVRAQPGERSESSWQVEPWPLPALVQSLHLVVGWAGALSEHGIQCVGLFIGGCVGSQLALGAAGKGTGWGVRSPGFLSRSPALWVRPPFNKHLLSPADSPKLCKVPGTQKVNKTWTLPSWNSQLSGGRD